MSWNLIQLRILIKFCGRFFVVRFHMQRMKWLAHVCVWCALNGTSLFVVKWMFLCTLEFSAINVAFASAESSLFIYDQFYVLLLLHLLHFAYPHMPSRVWCGVCALADSFAPNYTQFCLTSILAILNFQLVVKRCTFIRIYIRIWCDSALRSCCHCDTAELVPIFSSVFVSCVICISLARFIFCEKIYRIKNGCLKNRCFPFDSFLLAFSGIERRAGRCANVQRNRHSVWCEREGEREKVFFKLPTKIYKSAHDAHCIVYGRLLCSDYDVNRVWIATNARQWQWMRRADREMDEIDACNWFDVSFDEQNSYFRLPPHSDAIISF